MIIYSVCTYQFENDRGMEIGRASSDGDFPQHGKYPIISWLLSENEKVTQSCDFPYLVKQYGIRN